MVPRRRRESTPMPPAHGWAETKLMRGDVLRVIAHDAFPLDAEGRRLPLPQDFVMGIGGATRTLLDLIPPGRVGRALDIGCGSGAVTVFLDAERVIATDIDERALAAAAVTCHLSGFRRVDTDVWRDGDRLITFRQGSLLEPVAGQRFDLIVSNPPFVISGVGHTHRDSPLAGDGLTRQLLAELPAHLNAGGRAIVLATWLHPQGVPWQQHVLDLLPVGSVSAWVAQREALDLDAYVEVWGDDAALSAEERTAWRARLEQLEAEAIGFGWIVLEKSASHWVQVDDVSTATRVPTGIEVAEQLRAFAQQPTAVQLLHTPLAFAATHWRGPLALDPFQAALLERLRSGDTLMDAIDEVASRLPVDIDDLTAMGLAWTREAVSLGYLLLPG